MTNAKIIFICLDMIMVLIFLLLAFFFFKYPSKAIKFVAGYNLKSLDDRKLYDEVRICHDISKILLCYTLLFVIGAVIDFFTGWIGYCIAWVLFVVLLIMNIVRNRNFDINYKK